MGMCSAVGHRSNRKEGLKSTMWNLFSAVEVFWAGGNNVPFYLPMDRGEGVPKALHFDCGLVIIGFSF